MALMNTSNAKKLTMVFLSTFKIGLFTFGGGLAMIPFIQAEFCDKRGWLSDAELTDVIAAAQSLPGIMAVNASVLTCYRIGGAAGAVLGGIGAVLPSFLVLIFVTASYRVVVENAYVRGALRGVSGAVAAMFVNTLRKQRKASLADWWAFGFFVIALALIFLLPSINVIFIILGGGLSGFVLRTLISKKKTKQ